MKKILYTLLFAKDLKLEKVNPRKITRSFKKESQLPIKIITDILQMVYLIFKYIFTKLIIITKKEVICQEIVEENINVVDFTEYKLKKAK